MTDTDTPLTSLCSVCFTDTPKYVCPRDKVRTCSLACYKRHQQRASCNGQRDPTAYVKKNELTTAAGIDHDFNFLSGIERTFDQADKALRDRGMEASGGLKKRWHAEGPLQRYIRENGIRVDRAPVGMSRQKSNQTRFIQKSKRIVWTVEWVDVDGVKRLSEVHEATTLADAHAAMLEEKEKEGRKRKRSLDGQSRREAKRALEQGGEEIFAKEQPSAKVEQSAKAESKAEERQEEQALTNKELGDQNSGDPSYHDENSPQCQELSVDVKESRSEECPDQSTSANQGSYEQNNTGDEENPDHSAKRTSAQNGRQGPIQDSDRPTTAPDPITATMSPATTTDEPIAAAAAAAAIATTSITSSSTPSKEDSRNLILSRIHTEQSRQASLLRPGPPYFYLQKPHTSSTSRVLTPLSPSQTLTANLARQTVLEYPTVYVLDRDAHALPAGFVTATGYAREKADEEREIQEMLAAVPGLGAGGKSVVVGFGGGEGEGASAKGGRADKQEGWDESKILEMLKRDVHP
ncbi:hypothetical protein MBLNU459_g1985t1 [Dothideomycetes sp. NU459]